jgi:hypothetical protein
MIKRIAIDLDMSCPPDCWSHDLSGAPIPDGFVDVDHAVRMLDLPREISRSPDLQVEFVHPKNLTHYEFYRNDEDPSLLEISLQSEALNNVLRTLRQDPLNMKKYGRRLKAIWIQHSCYEGCVDYGFEGRSKQRFSIQDNGKTLKWTEEPTELSLLVLPTRIMGSILAAALGSENHGPTGKITRDLNTRTMTGGSLAPLQLCHASLNTKFIDDF